MAPPTRTTRHPAPKSNDTGVVTLPSFAGRSGEPRRWELVWAGERPTPMNEYRKLHHHARADYDAQWRELFGWLARKEHVPALPAVIITIHQTCRVGTPMPDPGSNFPTAKAAIDGLRDVGVIADDTGKFVKFLGFTAPEHSDIDRFVLVVEEYLPEVETAS